MQPTRPFPPFPGPGAGPQAHPFPGPEWTPGAHATAPSYPHGPPYRAAPRWSVEAARRAAAKPRAFRPIELAMLAAIAIAVDVTLWHEDGFAAGGYGAAVLFAVVLAAMFVAAKPRVLTARLAILEVLGAVVALRCAFEPTFGVVASGVALVGVIALALRRRQLFVPDAFLSALNGPIGLPSRVGAALRGVKALTARTRIGEVSILPIAIPAALIAMFLGVLSLANPVVASGVSAVAEAIASAIPLPSFGRVFLWLGALALATAFFRPKLWLAKGGEAAKTDVEATPTSLLVARNALAGLNVLFAVENLLDAGYLWTGKTPAGMTTQEYAHQGAFWLTVALLLLTAVIGVMFKGPLAYDARAKTARILAYAWMAQGIGFAAGSYRRIAMHVARSGLSDLRIVGVLGTTVVVSGVVLVAWKLYRQKTFFWLLRRQLDALALTLVVYAVVPTHLLGAEVNVARVSAGEHRPLLHMFAQSRHAESAPSLLPLLHHSDVRVRQGVAALLADERDELRARARASTTWRERDVASSRALATLEAHDAEIARTLGSTSPADAKRVLLEISRGANEDRSLEELLAIPAARSDVTVNEGRRDAD
ncbi:MAG: DUF4173 domain-containing protein [Labilithrix sp.]|nr:DUF4173 domain-containing protein [Labilithrix sp.]MCW5813486.1 DUF4173 domain-containing protein [Labilithrix sp.]